ncbi:MAG: translation elongation factor Ts [Armatimonadetes bacterium]|nr:translation elongation factor Ts [Armatimonadota bacterium]MDW8028813.1 translation elongation factor Ts [Armatimonadota bacterium]
MAQPVKVSVEEIKRLREETGAGVMDCKRALEQAGGDYEKAKEFLKAAGLLKAEKKTGRATREGVIACYIHHGNRLGAMVELNCESDFVARTEEFQQLAKEIAMQVAGMNPQYISREDVPKEVIDEQKRIFYEKAIAEGNSHEDAEQIANERLNKFFEEVCLLEQACIRDDSKTVGELLKEKIALFGENIVVSRFVRFVVGED